MLDKVKEAFSAYNFLGPKDLLQLATVAKIKRVKKGGLLVRSGDLNYHVFAVLKGLLRSYVYDSNGNELTMLFAPEKERIGSFETILRNKPSVENIQALEDSTVLVINSKSFDEITQKSTTLLKAQNKGLRDVLAISIDRVWFFTVLSPEERYQHFLDANPALEQRVKQKHLASYLGVTPQSLSRMRARMVNK